MANTKTIITRIKNKVDSLSAWQSYTGTLLDGEIAIVRVPTGTSYTNPVTGKSEPVVELLMKVGDGSTAFANLPWMSAKASDVYDWAKAATVEFNETDSKIYFKNAAGSTITSIDLSDLSSKIAALDSKLSDITVTPDGTSGVVKSVTKDGKGNIKVTRSAVVEGDIATDAVTEDKIKDGAVTVDKIGKGAVTNDKLSTDISSDKIKIDSKTLTAKIGEMDADILIAKDHATSDHDYLPSSTKYAGSASKGGPANSVANKLSIKLNSGTATEFDGSAAKSIDVTPATIGAASYDAVFGASGLKSRVDKNEADIEELTNTISRGVNFRGEVASAPTGTTYTLKGESTAKTALVGDIVICGEKEYIYTANNTWKELGDLSRVTTIENWHPETTNDTEYTKVKVDAHGHVKSGSNPTTLAGYGISDAYTKDDVYTKAEVNAELAKKALLSHKHGNIEDDGTIKSTVVTDATGILVYDSNNKIQRATAAQTRSIIGAGTSSLTLGTSANTAAAGNHTHDDTYGQAITNIQNSYVRYTATGKNDKNGNPTYQMHLGTDTDIIIFDCGGAED